MFNSIEIHVGSQLVDSAAAAMYCLVFSHRLLILESPNHELKTRSQSYAYLLEVWIL